MRRTFIAVSALSLAWFVVSAAEGHAQKGVIPTATVHTGPRIGGGHAGIAPAVLRPVGGARPALLPATHPVAPITGTLKWHSSSIDHHPWFGALGRDSVLRHHRRECRHFFPIFLYLNPGPGSYWNWALTYPLEFYYYPTPSYYPAGPETPLYYYGDYFGGGGTPPALGPAVAHIDVVVNDANADIWFSGYLTKSKGLVRHFDSPVLQPYKVYTYKIKASWEQNGQTVVQEREVVLAAGVRVLVDFTQSPAKK